MPTTVNPFVLSIDVKLPNKKIITKKKSLLIFEMVYLHYYAIIILVEKWSQNDNIIIYRNHFWGNLSSSKICYPDKPCDKPLFHTPGQCGQDHGQRGKSMK